MILSLSLAVESDGEGRRVRLAYQSEPYPETNLVIEIGTSVSEQVLHPERRAELKQILESYLEPGQKTALGPRLPHGFIETVIEETRRRMVNDAEWLCDLSSGPIRPIETPTTGHNRKN
jgi:hypothetical protein